MYKPIILWVRLVVWVFFPYLSTRSGKRPRGSEPFKSLNLAFFQLTHFCRSFLLIAGAGKSRPQCLRFWETLCRRIQNLAIWASQRMLFDRTKTFLCLLHRESLVLLRYLNWRNSVNGSEEFSGIQGFCGSCWGNTVKSSQSQIWDLLIFK